MAHQEYDVPPTLFKYRQYEGLESVNRYGLDTLFKFELFASSRQNFNDPFDVSLPYKYSESSYTLKNFIGEYIRLSKMNNRAYKPHNDLVYEATDRYNQIISDKEAHWKINAEIIREMDNKFYGILSLTSKYQNLLMWSHYSNNHKGYCLGISGQKFVEFLSKNYQEYGLKLGPVSYTDDYPTIDYGLEHYLERAFKLLFTKHSDWKYEAEYRLVLHNLANHKINFPRELLTEIYLGCEMSENHVDEIVGFVINENIKVVVYKMEMSYHHFGLDKNVILDNR